MECAVGYTETYVKLPEGEAIDTLRIVVVLRTRV